LTVPGQIPDNEGDILRLMFVCIQTTSFMVYVRVICTILTYVLKFYNCTSMS